LAAFFVVRESVESRAFNSTRRCCHQSGAALSNAVTRHFVTVQCGDEPGCKMRIALSEGLQLRYGPLWDATGARLRHRSTGSANCCCRVARWTSDPFRV